MITCRIQIIQRDAYCIRRGVGVPVVALDVVPEPSVLILVAGQNRQEIVAAAILKKEFPFRIVKGSCAAVNKLS